MNFSSIQKSVINSSVGFYQSYHVKGANRKLEERTKQSALLANRKIQTNADNLNAEDIRSLYVCLTVYANNISDKALPIGIRSIDIAYDLVNVFKDCLSDIQSM